MRKTLGTVLVSSLLSLTVAGGAQAQETLAQALTAAYKNSNLLTQNQALLRVQDENVAQLVAGLRPILAFTSTPSRNVATDVNTFSNQFSVSMLLYDFGATDLSIDAQKETVLATRAALLNVEQGVLLGAVDAFMKVILAEDRLKLSDSNVGVIREQLRAAQDRFTVGEITQTDVSQAEARLAVAEAGLVQAKTNLEIARQGYKAAIGKSPGRLQRPGQLPKAAKSADQAVATAQRMHPSITQAQHVVKARGFAIRKARADYWPKLNASASRGLTTMSGRPGGANVSGTYSLNLSVPIYSGGVKAARHRAAVAQEEADRANLLQQNLLVGQQAASAFANLQNAKAQVQAGTQRIRAAETAFRGVQEEATLGSRTTLDVLDAEQELLDAQVAKLEAENSVFTLSYTLLARMGLLTAEHLNLNVPIYDPAAYYDFAREAPTTSIQGKKLDRVLKALE